jgi:hypothetical protein
MILIPCGSNIIYETYENHLHRIMQKYEQRKLKQLKQSKSKSQGSEETPRERSLESAKQISQA